mmetsp:Transcript_26728/g.62472  ORF Transcript_26728/g.62472 Transcript_26728/m.62472 type:complete len:206 (-) Transcript_26728:162-779(-)
MRSSGSPSPSILARSRGCASMTSEMACFRAAAEGMALSLERTAQLTWFMEGKTTSGLTPYWRGSIRFSWDPSSRRSAPGLPATEEKSMALAVLLAEVDRNELEEVFALTVCGFVVSDGVEKACAVCITGAAFGVETRAIAAAATSSMPPRWVRGCCLCSMVEIELGFGVLSVSISISISVSVSVSILFRWGWVCCSAGLGRKGVC